MYKSISEILKNSSDRQVVIKKSMQFCCEILKEESTHALRISNDSIDTCHPCDQEGGFKGGCHKNDLINIHPCFYGGRRVGFPAIGWLLKSLSTSHLLLFHLSMISRLLAPNSMRL